MKRLALLIARLYPYAWRKRYGAEFDALIEDSKPSPMWLLDTLKGAFAAQIKVNGMRLATFGIVGAALAGAFAFTMKDSFRGTAVLKATNLNPVTAFEVQTSFSRNALWEIIEKNNLYENDRGRIPNEEIIHKLRLGIRISRQARSFGDIPLAIIVNVDASDRTKAKAAAEDLAKLLLNGERSLIEVSSPAVPLSPNRTWITLAGIAAGLLLGAAYSFLRNRRLFA